MKKYLTLFAILALTITTHAQPTNFFVSFDNYHVVQAFKCNSGYYVIGRANAYRSDNFYDVWIIKLDWQGNLEWEKRTILTLYNKRNRPASLTKDGNLVLAGSKIINYDNLSNGAVFLTVNDNGDINWIKQLNGERAPSIIQTSDGKFLGVLQSDDIDLSIIKLDSHGMAQWTKNLTQPETSGTFDAQILALSESNYVVRSQKNFFCIDEEANILWQYNFENELEKMLVDDNHCIIVITKVSDSLKKITKLNSEGILVWEKDLPGNWEDSELQLGLNNRSEYVIGWNNNVFEYSQAGSLLRSYELGVNGEDTLTYVNRGGHNDMLLGFEPDGIFTRANNDYESVGLSFGAYIGNAYFYPLEIKYYWKSYNVESVDLSFSTDNGLTWQNSVVNFPASEKRYTGELPPDFDGESVNVRIQNSQDPTLFKEQVISVPQIPEGNPQYDYIAANEIFMWIGNNGDGSHDPRTDGSGFYWPGGEDATVPAIFEDGLVFGGKLNGEIRVNGNTHRHGLMPGMVLPDGSPDDPNKPEYKIFKYKKDWESLPEGDERDKYLFNVKNWPVELGAPFVDENMNEEYDPEIDTPGNGADEYLFNVSNGADSTASIFFTDPPQSLPLEFHINTFGYDRDDELKNVVFKKYKIINKGIEPLTDFYISYWCDDDLGFAGDDAGGSDTTLNLVYTYNGDDFDDDYNGYGSPPPAVGHMLVQGPLVKGDTVDRGIFNGRWIDGYKNLPMTYSGGIFKHERPLMAPYDANEYYDAFQCLDRYGNPIIDPNTNEPVHHMLAGDPVTGTGWYWGDGWPDGLEPHDVRNQLVTGPFEFAAGDTQEVVIAIFMAQGTDRLNSITELRNTAEKVNEFFYDELTDVKEKETLPNKVELSQNYPNPFNPTTKIKFSIPSVETTRRVVSTKLVVYDILGREIKTLLNKKLTPGRYEVEFNGENLSSGVYLYRLQVGDTHIVKKMMLLK